MSQEKKHIATIKLQLVPGVESNAIAPALGQKGIPLKIFNERFKEMTKSLNGVVKDPVNVKLICFSDKSFDIYYHSVPSTAFLIKKTLGIQTSTKKAAKGNKDNLSTKANASTKGASRKRYTITREQVISVAKMKKEDLCVNTLEAAIKVVEGTLRSMAIDIIEERR